MTTKKTRPNFKLNYNEDYREFFATGAFGGMNPNKCSITFFDDKPVLSIPDNGGIQLTMKEVNREVQASVNLTPVQFKQVAEWMIRNVQAYESRFGKIELRKEDENKPIGFIS
jgi:hypothetical protein